MPKKKLKTGSNSKNRIQNPFLLYEYKKIDKKAVTFLFIEFRAHFWFKIRVHATAANF